MKKKLISAICASAALMTLASCSSSTDVDLTTIRSDIDAVDLTYVKDKYNLNFIYDLDNNANRLDTTVEIDSGTDYYAVYVNKNLADSAFVYSYNIDEDLNNLGDRIQYYTVNALTFQTSNSIYDSEVSSIATALYNSEHGLHQYNDDFAFEVNTLAALSFNKSAADAKAAYNNGKRNVTLNIVYVPTFVVRNYGADGNKQKILQKVVFAPIYSCYSSEGKEISENGELIDSKISSIQTKEIVFDGSHVSNEKPAE